MGLWTGQGKKKENVTIHLNSNKKPWKIGKGDDCITLK
jgi:hypothetical protein